MGSIAELIEEKKQERNRLDEQIRHLENALLAERGARATQGRRLTVLEMASAVLIDRQRIMKAKDISLAIEKRFGVHVKAHSLGTMLYRSAIERQKIFVKDPKQKNSYGLLDWTASAELQEKL